MTDFSNKTCLFPGRFQLFHTGQMMVLEGMVKLCGKVVVVIGSSDQRDTKEHPFSLDERREMVQRALQEKNLVEANVVIVGVPDVAEDAKWLDHVRGKGAAVGAGWA